MDSIGAFSDGTRIKVRLPSQLVFDLFLQGTGPWIVGSSLACDIPLRGKLVSRRHLELSLNEGRLVFRDLDSTNGTFLNEERTGGGFLDEGATLRIGDIIIQRAGTMVWPSFTEHGTVPLRLRSMVDVAWGQEARGEAAGDARLFALEDVARLIGDSLIEGRSGHECQSICRFVGESLHMEAVRCYVWEPGGLCLRAEEGSFPAVRIGHDLVQQVASLPKMGAFEWQDGEGALTLVSVPVQMEGRRVILLGATRDTFDPMVRYQEILPVLNVLCRLVIRWTDDIHQHEARVGELKDRLVSLQAGLVGEDDASEPIVGQCPALLKEIQAVKQVAPTEMAVLLCGATGTGKELFARRVHRLSNRSGGPFVPINCASIPETLLESELFGVERGAYTGADRSRAGLFEKAHGGTLFLDEIADLPLGLQPKLLRVLEEKHVAPLGSARSRPVDVRVVAATNQDPAELIKTGRFREDLYFRLAGVLIRIPPLNERGADILLLANFFLQVANREFGRTVRGFEEGAVRVLRSYSWPGNVRQLQALVKQMVLTAESKAISPEMVMAALDRYHPGMAKSDGQYWNMTWSKALETFEGDYFKRRLSENSGSMSALARELGMTRPNLYLKIKKYGLKTARE